MDELLDQDVPATDISTRIATELGYTPKKVDKYINQILTYRARKYIDGDPTLFDTEFLSEMESLLDECKANLQQAKGGTLDPRTGEHVYDTGAVSKAIETQLKLHRLVDEHNVRTGRYVSKSEISLRMEDIQKSPDFITYQNAFLTFLKHKDIDPQEFFSFIEQQARLANAKKVVPTGGDMNDQAP